LDTIPSGTVSIIHNLNDFVVERARTARRYISKTKPPYAIHDLNIIELDKSADSLSDDIMALFRSNTSFGLISESGMPAIADPGSRIVEEAHKSGFTVKPLVGPSSIFLALAASGFNGQGFSFNGYLPIKDQELATSLRQIEKKIVTNKETQIFIETPYRNNRLYQTILKRISPHLKLCIAIDITGDDEKIQTKSIKEWKRVNLHLEKVPTIFLLSY